MHMEYMYSLGDKQKFKTSKQMGLPYIQHMGTMPGSTCPEHAHHGLSNENAISQSLIKAKDNSHCKHTTV